MDECSSLFLDHEKEILDGSFDQALARRLPANDAFKEIIKISIEKIYRARSVVEIEAAGHEVLPGLLEEFTQAGFHMMEQKISRKYGNLQKLLPPEITANVKSNPGNYYLMLRDIVDFISGMTDRHAISLYRKIKGMSL